MMESSFGRIRLNTDNAIAWVQLDSFLGEIVDRASTFGDALFLSIVKDKTLQIAAQMIHDD